MSYTLYGPVAKRVLIAASLLLLLSLSITGILPNALRANLELVQWTELMFAHVPAGDVRAVFAGLDYTPPPGGVPRLLLELSPERQSQAEIDAIASMDPTGESALTLALFFGDLGHTARAGEWWAHIEQRGNCAFSVWYYRGRAAEKDGQWESAITHYEKAALTPITACDRMGQSDALYRAGFIWQGRGQREAREQAVALYRRAADIHDFRSATHRAETYYQMGVLLFMLGPENDAEVIEALNTALALRPTHSWTLLVLGRAIYRMSGDFALAEHYLLKAYEQNPSGNWRFPFYCGKLYESEGRVEEARQYYLRALEIAPDHPQVVAALDALPAGN
jgi:tetratricopeptide (TPR) repeat protein